MPHTSGEYEPVRLELHSLTPALALEVLPHGLTFHRLYVQADGRTHDILVGPEAPSDHGEFPYTNSIIGRYANRVPVGTHTLSSPSAPDSTTTLKTLTHPAHTPAVSLHGGPDCMDAHPFTRLNLASDKPTLFSAAEFTTLRALPAAEVWTYTSPAGAQGYPGTLTVEVLTALLDAPTPAAAPGEGATYDLGSVLVVYRAASDALTPVNLTQHWGFNLDASLRAREPKAARAAYPAPIDTVHQHTLTLGADATVELDQDALATGKLSPASGSSDFQKGRKIGEGWPGSGYDEFYVFKEPSKEKTKVSKKELEGADFVKSAARPKAQLGVPAGSLEGAKSGLKVDFFTNQAGVQFYTANFYDRQNARKKIHGGTGAKATGDGYGPGAAAFLEFHAPIAAFLNPGLVRNGDDTLIAPGEVYHHWVRADVSARSVPEESLV